MGTSKFFRKNDFSDDVILNSRFRDAFASDEDGVDNLNCDPIRGQAANVIPLCYLPPFDGHYPPMPGTSEWNRGEVESEIEAQVDIWRNKSLEAYQSQWTCIQRLLQEIAKLRQLLKRQDYSQRRLRRENEVLQKMLLQSKA